MWIQDSGETLFLVVTSPTIRGKHASDLSKDTDWMNRVDISNDIAIRMFVLKQESAKIRLAALHHLFDSGDHGRVTDDNSLVKTRKERTSGNG